MGSVSKSTTAARGSRMSAGTDLYERDFLRWSEEQAAILRSAPASGTNLPLDWNNLAEEIDSLGKALRVELRNRLATIVEHLLKLQVSPAIDPRAGWIETVQRERLEVETLLDENPSLRATIPESLPVADRKGRKLAQLSLERHGEWSPSAERALAATRFTEGQVVGPWLPGTEATVRT